MISAPACRRNALQLVGKRHSEWTRQREPANLPQVRQLRFRRVKAWSRSHQRERQRAGLRFKEVIQPQVPLRLPCYDFVPVMNHTVVTVLPKVRLATSGATHFHDVTGGVYKARERIHRDVLIRDY